MVVVVWEGERHLSNNCRGSSGLEEEGEERELEEEEEEENKLQSITIWK